MLLRVGLAVMCHIVGMSAPAFRARVNAGDFPQSVDGKYDVPRCIKAWHEWKSSTGKNPRHVIEEQRAIKFKRENQLAAGELMPVQEVEFLQQETIAIYNMALESMPGRVASVAAMQEAAVVHEAVRVECGRCTQRIRDAVQVKIDLLNRISDQPEGVDIND